MKMWQPARNNKIGFECDVCGNYFGDIRLSNICQMCQKRICTRLLDFWRVCRLISRTIDSGELPCLSVVHSSSLGLVI
jgi:hypothetical protein